MEYWNHGIMGFGILEEKMKMLKGNTILIIVLAVFSVVTLWGCAGNLPEGKRVDYLPLFR